MIRILHAALVAALLCLAAPAPAGTVAQALSRAEAHLREGRPAAALDVLQGLRPQSPPETARHLWAQAVAHMAEGRPEVAVPLLERLAALVPGESRVAGALAEARAALTEGQGNGPARPQVWLRFAVVPESNPHRRTGADSISLGGWDFALDPAARAASGTGLRLGFGVGWSPALGPRTRARLLAVVDARLYPGGDHNDITLRTEAGIETARGRLRFGAGVLADRRWLGGDGHSRGVGVWATAAHPVGTAGLLDLRIEAIDRHHDRFAGADGWRISGTLGYRHALSDATTLRAGLSFGRTLAALDSESLSSVGVSLGLDHAFRTGLRVGLDASLGRTGHDAPAPLFAVVREDRNSVLSLRMQHRDVTVFGLTPVVEVAVERNRSSIALHDWANTRVSVGFTRRF
jgi:outer membrane protein